MKPYIWLQTSDGLIQQVEQEIAMLCPVICQEVAQIRNINLLMKNSFGWTQRDFVIWHPAAHSLQLKPLVDLTSRALARIIEGKSPEEIREIFHLPDDLTEEEKLEPLRYMTDDPRIRLLNRLYAKKRKELKERDRLKNIEVEEEHIDERSVDELLSFINGENGDLKGSKTSKSKKKNRRRKDQGKNSSINEAHGKELNGYNSVCQSVEADGFQDRTGQTSNVQDAGDDNFSVKVECDDDEIDPALKEIIDREVEDFARRLNSDWPERMQEILSSGQ
ncbi:SKP1-like protein 21 [Quillaja saponaria]|uniref:SKP1-like protein 21 n=1 Tax=Quillaja saponaria TaxID=32244 RepID=A0AAD7PD25_QUISA|nr:SKP1-like protein 21 [Quillaja saponaria]